MSNNEEISLEKFIELIRGHSIKECYLANTKKEKDRESSGLSEYGKEQLRKSILIDASDSKYVDIDFDYGFHRFILELENGIKIQFTGSEWNAIEVI